MPSRPSPSLLLPALRHASPLWRARAFSTIAPGTVKDAVTNRGERAPTPTLKPDKPYYVTTPIYYVNASPHIGHLHSSVLADVLTRWRDLRAGFIVRRSRDVMPQLPSECDSLRSVMATGTDEHGLKIQKAAEAAGVVPRDLCDVVSRRFQDLAEAADIDYSAFIRTTEARHRVAASELWRRLIESGHIYKGIHRGWYAVSDEAFYTDAQVQKKVNERTRERWMEAIESGQRVEWMEEENYRFRLSAFRDQLLKWLEANPAAIRPRQRHMEVVSEIRAGLQDLSISRPRSRLKWGIPVPGDDEHTMYVWVEALANYLTITGFPWDADSGAQQLGYGKDGGEIRRVVPRSAWPADVHVVGKDIVRFHAIYWPALLLAASLPLPGTILAHAHWTMNKAKMSKSRGNVADPFEALQRFGVDVMRFYLMRVGGSLGNDSDYSPAILLDYYRKDLKGQLGNLLSRVLAPKIQARLTEAEAAGADPSFADLVSGANVDAADRKIDESLRQLPGLVSRHMDDFEISKALAAIFDTIAEANTHISDLMPWTKKTSAWEARRAIFYTTETLRMSGILLQPFMPGKMGDLLDQLGVPEDRRTWTALGLGQGGQQLATSEDAGKKVKRLPLFPPLEEETQARSA